MSLQIKNSNWLGAPQAMPIAYVASGLFATLAFWTFVDYRSWLAFGTGGTPPTPSGYWRMTKIRFNQMMSSEDLNDPSPLKTDGVRYLPNLSQRPYKRPRILSRTMPQRQHLESITKEASQKVHSLVETFYEKHTDILEHKLSKTEGGSTDAIFAKEDLQTLNPEARQYKFLAREIAHVHPADNSLHVWLSEADSHEVVRSGWGQRFPTNFIPGGKNIASPGFTMVFAPREESDLAVIEQIVNAGISFITGVNVM